MLEQDTYCAVLEKETSEKLIFKCAKNYFDSFNQQQFEQTSELFTAQGKLHPPFDSPLVGRDAIFTYLQRAAVDMQAVLGPSDQWTVEAMETGSSQIAIKGKVKALLFTVNVGWQFVVTQNNQISEVRIKLLASPRELFNLRAVAKP